MQATNNASLGLAATSLTNSAAAASVTLAPPSNSTTANYVEIQAQFELLVELRRFINIDLFQRGYYQIRLAIKCANKQIPTKILVQLENNSNNNNLSEVMFPSSIQDEYAISKTFLILYRNEDIILDDQILFKISALVNAFNLTESFERLDLQLSIELWFTENDFKPSRQSQNALNVNESFVQLQQTNSFINLNSLTGNNSSNAGQSQLQTNNTQQSSSNIMQQLCARIFKIHFEPRQGIHLQLPVLFDYFHLSAVLVTIHCTLLTLLPPVMLGTNYQRSSTLSAILFGKDISQFKDPSEIITNNLMKRAAHLHNQICALLLTSYENLQDHIIKMSGYLNEYEKKNLNIEYINCQEKLNKLCEIIQQCAEPETLDDLANTHVAQCSAENIMQWCVYMDNFSLNQAIAPVLAQEYHNKRLKRFSESFFTKELPRSRNLQENYEMSDNYIGLNDFIRQSTYFQQLPDLIVSCDDLDGLPESMPIIFEENYVPTLISSSKSSPQPLSVDSLINYFHRNNNLQNISISKENTQQKLSQQQKQIDNNKLNKNSKKLHRRFKKKSGHDILDDPSSIQLVSYRKVNDYFADIVPINTAALTLSQPPPSSLNLQKQQQPNHSGLLHCYSASSSPPMSIPLSLQQHPRSEQDIQSKLMKIKANLVMPSSVTLSSSQGNLDSIIEYKVTENNPSQQNQKQTAVRRINRSNSIKNELLKKSFTKKMNEEWSEQLKRKRSTGNTSPSNDSNVEINQQFQNEILENIDQNNDKENAELNEHSKKTNNFQSMPNLNSIQHSSKLTTITLETPITKPTSSEGSSSSASSTQQALSESTSSSSRKELTTTFMNNENQQKTINKNNKIDDLIEDCNKNLVFVNKNVDPNNESYNNDQEEIDNFDNKSNVFSSAKQQPPSDCSFKSRALYESFRGKASTLERPKVVSVITGSSMEIGNSCGQARRNLNKIICSSVAHSNYQEAMNINQENCNKQLNDSINRVLNSNNDDNDLKNNLMSNVANNVSDSRSLNSTCNLDSSVLALNNSVRRIVATVVGSGLENSEDRKKSNEKSQLNISSTSSIRSSGRSNKSSLVKQLTIHMDKNSLSSYLSESLYKFFLAKEELRRTMLSKYQYQGNIYSEYSSLFCSAPYFYPELTPKLTPYSSIININNNQQPENNNIVSTQQTNSDVTSLNEHNKLSRSSIMSSIKSKTKIFNKMFTSNQQKYRKQQRSNLENELNLANVEIDAEYSSDISSSAFNDDLNENENNEYISGENEQEDDEKLHLCVCVHGLDGNSGDLRLIRTYLELALPGAKLDFLMSEHNQENTFDNIEIMSKQLIAEINDYVDTFGILPARISFIGHSLGNLIIRAAVVHDDFKPYIGKLHTYLSLSGPHLGTLYNSSGLINMGMWIMQKWKKSGSLLQLSLKDNPDVYKTFLYQLSTKPTFKNFKNILLVSSPQDRYVPFHSARIELCKQATKDSMFGQVYREMLTNILKPIQDNSAITFKRYSAFHSLPSGTSNFIGRAAHIAVLDSELFVEKLIIIAVAKYFR